jgi:hypothetical protein
MVFKPIIPIVLELDFKAMFHLLWLSFLFVFHRHTKKKDYSDWFSLLCRTMDSQQQVYLKSTYKNLNNIMFDFYLFFNCVVVICWSLDKIEKIVQCQIIIKFSNCTFNSWDIKCHINKHDWKLLNVNHLVNVVELTQTDQVSNN